MSWARRAAVTGCASARYPTPAQALLIEQAAKTALIAQAVSNYLVQQRTLVRPDASLLPAVVQHQQLVAGLVRILLALGLKREAKPVETLADFIAARSNGAR